MHPAFQVGVEAIQSVGTTLYRGLVKQGSQSLPLGTLRDSKDVAMMDATITVDFLNKHCR